MTRLLVTGFDAFGGRAFNPSEAIVRGLAADPPAADVHALVLPTVYAEAASRVAAAVRTLRPDAMLMFGLAESSPGLRLERFALNSVDSAAADNAGACRPGQPVVPGGPAAYATACDVHALAARLAGAVPEVSVSTNAGGYVCNTVYYAALHAIAESGLPTRALFVHVPWMHKPRTAEEFAEAPAAAHDRVARAVIDAFLGG
jgi:pyroglutamyl-peptidase